jgi:hypothetical protein
MVMSTAKADPIVFPEPCLLSLKLRLRRAGMRIERKGKHFRLMVGSQVLLDRAPTVHCAFVLLREAEDFLKSQGFRLVADSCDWANTEGDDAGIYAVQHDRYGTVKAWRVEINRGLTLEEVAAFTNRRLPR